MMPSVSAERPHRRQAVDGDLSPSRRSGQRAQLAGWPRSSVTVGALHRVHLAELGGVLKLIFRKCLPKICLNSI